MAGGPLYVIPHADLPSELRMAESGKTPVELKAKSAAYVIDRHGAVEAFVKNDHLGFTIPYLHNGQPHDYVPDFIVRMNGRPAPERLHVILETKGFDPLKEIKQQAAERWVAAVNADATHGRWTYKMMKSLGEIGPTLTALAKE